MTSISALLKERVVVLDGAMGTQIFLNKPTVEDYGGVQFEGCVELLNERRKEWIQKIHENYLNAGADAVETNSFGCNEIVLADFGMAHRAFELNVQAARLAREVASGFAEQKYVVGSVGPGSKLLTLGHVDYDTMCRSYSVQMQGLMEGGVDALLIETAQDLGQIKCAVRAAHHAMKQTGKRCPVWVQVTMETNGNTLLGSDLSAVLTSVEPLGIEVLGLNCATGPDEMSKHVSFLSQSSPFLVSCLPNAGLPLNVDGELVYPQSPEVFAEKVQKMAVNFGVNIVGGCCGTSPAHIKALAARIKGQVQPDRHVTMERSVASLYTSVSLAQEPRPLFVGERTNANGSKKFRELLAANDYDALVGIARDQLREGAHVLDVCVACVGRDEARDMEEFVRRLVTQVNIPLMIDSTEVKVIEAALKRAPGKCIVNSINLEDGDAKARQILTLCREYGAGVVALTIDEQGMAKTAARKLEIAQRLYDIAVKEFGMAEGDLCFDPLTFTLGSGAEDLRTSAVETLESITRIKQAMPGVRINLGLSNVSFGLSPYVRQVLNSVMLSEAVKCGLDMAILNASKILPMGRIGEEERQLCEDLIFNRRTGGYDPLKKLIEKFSGVGAKGVDKKSARATFSVEERLKVDIVDGERSLIIEDTLEALKTHSPLEIINDILLAGMKTVGERFATGEMQLPFVLESAEAMKHAVATLEPHMEKDSHQAKGRMVLATVKGDVHDIGKNLVDIILSNNGFVVENLGIKQPVDDVLKACLGKDVDAIGLSGLLVKSTQIMKENLEQMAAGGVRLPVILGGAALTREFVEVDCQSVYEGPVFYAADAFEGLRLMDALCEAKRSGRPVVAEEIRHAANPGPTAGTGETAPAIKGEVCVVSAAKTLAELDKNGQSSWVKKDLTVPVPPFWGTHLLSEETASLWDFLDEFALIRGRWGFKQGALSDEAFEQTLTESAQPLLASWRERITAENLLEPKALYGYYPVCSAGNTLYVYAPDTMAAQPHESRKVLATLDFPRQNSGRRLCIADYFKTVDSGEVDVLGLQLVTMGARASAYAAELYRAEKFSEYFQFHGLTTELAEALAEKTHARIRAELGISVKDARDKRALFNQGYQGSRYSFGYPACPHLEGNRVILDLLGAQEIGVTLTEALQMVPEQSTSALVTWHPQARYFSV